MKQSIHPGCLRNCSDEVRPEGICSLIADTLDERKVRCVGDWAVDKITYLEKYFGIFAKGMKEAWAGHLNYIEICSGPGRCITRQSGKEIDGTSLAILKHPNFKNIEKAFFIDLAGPVVETLSSRIQALGTDVASHAHAILGDYAKPKNFVAEMKRLGLSNRSLNLVFIDPTDCSVPFETIRFLNENLGRSDFVINFPFGTDMNRNIRNAILDPSFSKNRMKYAQFLGDDTFLLSSELRDAALGIDQHMLMSLMNEKYFDQIGRLGHVHRDYVKVEHYYYLCFFSSHPKGLEFWNKCKKYTPDGQSNFDF